MELAEFKSQVIAGVKNNYSANVMFAAYPQWKQGNIDAGRCGATAQDKIDMDVFLNAKWDEITAVETAINALTDQTILTNFTQSNDTDESAYVASVLTGLTTDDQKLYTACALRFLQMRG